MGDFTYKTMKSPRLMLWKADFEYVVFASVHESWSYLVDKVKLGNLRPVDQNPHKMQHLHPDHSHDNRICVGFDSEKVHNLENNQGCPIRPILWTYHNETKITRSQVFIVLVCHHP